MRNLVGALAVLVVTANAWAQCEPKVFKFNGSVPIPDNGTASASITIEPSPLCDTIADLNVDLIVNHTWQGDLIMTLTHTQPGQNPKTTTLVNRPGNPQSTFGFSADNYGTTANKFTLDDEAASTYDLPQVPNPGIPNVGGAWRPDGGNLAIYDGQSKAGVWTLTVSDHAGGDVGSILNFGLTIQNVPEPMSLALLGLGGLLIRRRR